MFYEIMQNLWDNYRGRLVGSLFGFIIGAMFLILGFFQTIFLLICIIGGYLLGKHIDNKEDLMDILDRLLPPGHHR